MNADADPTSERLAVATHRLDGLEGRMSRAEQRLECLDDRSHEQALKIAVFQAEVRRTFSFQLALASLAITVATTLVRIFVP